MSLHQNIIGNINGLMKALHFSIHGLTNKSQNSIVAQALVKLESSITFKTTQISSLFSILRSTSNFRIDKDVKGKRSIRSNSAARNLVHAISVFFLMCLV